MAQRRRDLAAVDTPLEPVHRPEEAGHERVDRGRVELGGRAALHDPAGEHGVDPVADPDRLLGVVGHQQHRGPGLAQECQGLVAHLRAQRGVEGRERLVEQHQLRRGRQRAGQRHALLLAAGESVRVGARVGRHVDGGQQLGDAPLAPTPVAAVEPEGDVLADAQMREQGEVLEHQADPAPLRRQQRAGLGEHAAVERDPAGLQGLEPGDQPQRRGLAAARGTDEAMDLARRDRERRPRSTTSRSPNRCDRSATWRPGGRGRRRSRALGWLRSGGSRF